MPRVFILIFVILPFIGVAQNQKTKELEVQADTLMRRENFKEAIKLYTKVIESSGLKELSDFNALYKRAVSYYRLQEFKNSLQDIDLLISKNPQIPQGHVLKALVYRDMQDNDKQLESVERAVELTQDPGLIKWRASLLLEKGSIPEAKRDLLFVRQIQTDPEIETQLGFAYHSLEDIDSAMYCINKAIELEPTYLPAYYYAGSFCLQEELYELGLKYLNLGLSLEPSNLSLILYKGIALIELKKTDEGCRFLRKAFEGGEDNAKDYLVEYCYK